MRAYPLLVIVAWASLSCAAEFDRYGGDASLTLEATGWFRVEKVEGRWWFVTPEGHPFFSTGVNHVLPDGYATKGGRKAYQEAIRARYGSDEAWAKATRARLTDWGFNTLGSWSRYDLFPEFPYTAQIDLAAAAGADWQHGTFPDVYAADFEEKVRARAKEQCVPRAADPWLVGYFFDNELRWGPDWRGLTGLFEQYALLSKGSAGKKAWVEFLRARYDGDWPAFRRVWISWEGGFDDLLKTWFLIPRLGSLDRVRADRDAFAEAVAERYFEVCGKAVREADPRHLMLGARFHAGGAPEGVVRACGRHCDVVTVNFYTMGKGIDAALCRGLGSLPTDDWLARYAEVSGRPVLVTEFSFKARDTGHPNRHGAGLPVATQADRASAFEEYARRCLAAPHIVGYHWFSWVDEPPEGRFDGEDCNYGIVRESDDPYEALTAAMKRVQDRACEIRRAK